MQCEEVSSSLVPFVQYYPNQYEGWGEMHSLTVQLYEDIIAHSGNWIAPKVLTGNDEGFGDSATNREGQRHLLREVLKRTYSMSTSRLSWQVKAATDQPYFAVSLC